MLKAIHLALLTGAVLGLAAPAQAQSWPTRPITVVVSQAAGNSPDVLCRIIVDKMGRASCRERV